jgi:hypothetical protein
LLPHQHREVTHEQSHHVEVQLEETNRGWRITVACQYEAPILTSVSFVFGAEGELSGDGIEGGGSSPLRGDSAVKPQVSPVRLWSEGTVRYTAGGDFIEVAGGAGQHAVKGISNAPHPAGCQTVLVNLVTPYRHTFDVILSGKGQ